MTRSWKWMTFMQYFVISLRPFFIFIISRPKERQNGPVFVSDILTCCSSDNLRKNPAANCSDMETVKSEIRSRSWSRASNETDEWRWWPRQHQKCTSIDRPRIKRLITSIKELKISPADRGSEKKGAKKKIDLAKSIAEGRSSMWLLRFIWRHAKNALGWNNVYDTCY